MARVTGIGGVFFKVNLAFAIAALALLPAGAACFMRAPPAPAARAGKVLDGGVVVAWSPGYRVSFYGIERLHSFDIGKYDRIAAHLVSEGLLTPGPFARAEPVGDTNLARVHDPAYLASLRDHKALSAALEISVPAFFRPSAIEERVLQPFQRAVGGTIEAARAARDHGLGINLGGGFHHARPDMGHGFCVYSDVALAIDTLRQEGLQGNVLIVDTDAHQGDGSHAFFAGDDSVFSFSMHQDNIFPKPKLKGDLDVPLAGGTGDDAFLAALESNLTPLFDRVEPVLIVHVAGSDVLRDDPLAGLNMTPEGLIARDLLVGRLAAEQSVPLVHLLAGGYGPSAADAQARSVAALIRQLQAGQAGQAGSR